MAPSKLVVPQVVRPIMIPVTSRGIGVATTQISYVSHKYGENLGVPDIYAQYRVYLGLLEAKILSLKSKFPLIPRFTENTYQHIGMTSSMLRILETCTMVPIMIKKIIDAVGIVMLDDTIYLPVVAKSENVHKELIPCPENVMLTSLRKVVKALADVATPAAVRQRFEANNTIPGAEWDNHLLQNPDDIIPDDYNLVEGLYDDVQLIAPFLSRLQKHAPKMVGGALDSKETGRASLFVSNELGTLRCPNKHAGEDLDLYYDRCIMEGNITHYTSPYKLTPAERMEGQITLLGEQPTVMDMRRPLYLVRDKAVHPYFMSSDFKGTSQFIYATY